MAFMESRSIDYVTETFCSWCTCRGLLSSRACKGLAWPWALARVVPAKLALVERMGEACLRMR